MAGLDTLSKLLAMQTQMQNQQNQQVQMNRQAQIDAFNMQKYNDAMRQQQLTNAMAQQKENRLQSAYEGQIGLEKLLADRAGRAMGQGGEDGPNPPQALPGMNLLQTDILASGKPGSLSFAKELGGLSKDGSDALYGQLLRAYGTDAGFIIQEYGNGKVPRSVDEFNAMTEAAANDPDYAKNRTNWSNNRVANTIKLEGASADNPTMNVGTDRFGNQVLLSSQGDVVDQKLNNLTTEEAKSLSEYRTIYGDLNQVEQKFNALFTGPFQGNWSNVKSKFVDMPEYVDFKNNVDQLRTIIYGLSGKQINETEQKWLDSILPKIYNPDENFGANLEAIKEWVKDRQQAQLIELRNARKFTSTQPLKDTKPTNVNFEELYNRAYSELGANASDEAVDAKVNEYMQGAK